MNIINKKISRIIECDCENLSIDRSRLCCDIEECNLAGSAFVKSQLKGAGFVEDDIRGAGFTQCDLSGAGIESCDLTGAAIANCKLDGMTIDGINVQEMMDFYKKNFKGEFDNE